MACAASLNDSSTAGGIWVLSSSLSAASSCAWSASSGSWYLVRKRTAVESRSVAVARRQPLRVIAARHEIGSGQRGELRGPTRHRQLAGKDSADERLRRRIR